MARPAFRYAHQPSLVVVIVIVAAAVAMAAIRPEADPLRTAVQLQDVPAARGPVQTIHVLRDEGKARRAESVFQRRESMVPWIRSSRSHGGASGDVETI